MSILFSFLFVLWWFWVISEGDLLDGRHGFGSFPCKTKISESLQNLCVDGFFLFGVFLTKKGFVPGEAVFLGIPKGGVAHQADKTWLPLNPWLIWQRK